MLFNQLSPLPQPGEIWEIGFDVEAVAYALVVHESDVAVTIMLLSVATEYYSEVDLLLPVAITGLDRAVLAETWNVETMAIEHLQRRVGQRLSREIYDLLLSIGDFYHGLLVTMPDLSLMPVVGLQQTASHLTRGEIAEFHRQEKVWLQSLHPVTMAWTANLVDQAIAIEREFADAVTRISLSRWLQQLHESEWRDVFGLKPARVMAVRHLVADQEIADTVVNLTTADSEVLRRQLIKRLGLAVGNRQAQQALINVVNTTTDDETLWTAIDSLQRIAPDSQMGVRRLKKINLGVSLDFVVSVVGRADQRISVLLQVYPDKSAVYLPADLKMLLQDKDEQELWQVVAQDGDYCIQMKFNGVPGEEFGVYLELGERQANLLQRHFVNEKFVI
jgi:Protein of unknown function (DUF1822)